VKVRAVTTLTEAIEETAASLGISTGAAKMKIIQACAADAFGTSWYGYYRGGSPEITSHEWAGADIIMVEGDAVLVPANGGQRKRGISVDADFQAWLKTQAPCAGADKLPRQDNRQRGAKSRRVIGAVRLIWGAEGPPAYLAPKIICREIRDRLKAEEGADPKMDDKTIIRGVRRKA
jgi:hypothetical protein